VIVDPERAVDDCAEEEAAAGPLVKEVELLVPYTRAKEYGKRRVLGGEQKDWWQLGKCDET
jgi:hypothetical protein